MASALTRQRCQDVPRLGARAGDFGVGINHVRTCLVNRIGERSPFVQDAMFEEHERHLRVARGVRDGRELLGAPETFSRQVHARAAVEHRLQPFVQSPLGH